MTSPPWLRLLVSCALLGPASTATQGCIGPLSTPCEEIESCVDGRVVNTCLATGKVERSFSCETGTCTEGYRASGARYATCSIGTDARCDGNREDGYCEGEMANQCHGAYRYAETDCAAHGLVCEAFFDTSEGRGVRCVLAHTPDPECEAAVNMPSLPRPRHHCFDGRITECFGKFRAAHRRCSELGLSCVEMAPEEGPGATCL